jgi:ABC-type sugar transport system ATPase subunit
MITVHDVSKHFGGVQALRGVTLEFKAGEIHGLVGENGAGKSTLMKILAGVYAPDAGQLLMDGKPLHLQNPKHAYDIGIRIVYQELSLVPALTVAENLYLHRFSAGNLQAVRRKSLIGEAQALLEEWGVGVSPSIRVEQLAMGKRQLVEIIREVSKKGRLLILDEPTSSLTSREIDQLFRVLRRLIERNMSIIFISHRLNEVLAISDTLSVLRNGRWVATRPARELQPEDIVNFMVGHEIKDLFPKVPVPLGETLLSLRGLSGNGFQDISFNLRRGEILGIGGLIGAGRSELLRGLFGVNPIRAGKAELEGNPLLIRGAQKAIQQGLALLSESRTEEGIFPELSVAKNLIMMKLEEVFRRGWLSFSLMQKKVGDLVKSLNVATYNPYQQQVIQLSGGNQQKVALGRLLGAHPRILLLDEPTRGVDVGTKAELHRIMGNFVAQGNGILMVSSDLPELTGMCDRIIVLHQGRMTGHFDRNEFNEEAILQCAMGLSHRLPKI